MAKNLVSATILAPLTRMLTPQNSFYGFLVPKKFLSLLDRVLPLIGIRHRSKLPLYAL